MITVLELLTFYIAAILLGKRVKRVRLSTYAYVALIALLQTCTLLLHLLTKEIPRL